jgi:hypothetical protein
MNKKYNFPLLAFFLIALSNATTLLSQGVGINNTNSTPDASAMLDVNSTDKGILVPRMTTTQRAAIANPATGLLVFDNTSTSFWFYNGTAWTELGSDNLGNHIATNNVQVDGNWLSNDGDNEGIYIDSDGNVGIGTNTPTSLFQAQTSSTVTETSLAKFTTGNGRSLEILQPNLSHIDNAFTLFTNNAFEFRVDGYQPLTLDAYGLVGVNTLAPQEELHVTGNIRMVDGNEQLGYILASDANGTASWTDPSSLTESTFSVVNNVVLPNTNLIDESTDDFVFGSTQIDDDGNINHYNRFFFDKSKGAFRAGSTQNSNWDSTSVGDLSTAFGNSTIASGTGAVAWGYNTTASGSYTTASGYETVASGSYSTASGLRTLASDFYANAWGGYTEATDNYTTAWGSYTKATNQYATAWGRNTQATGLYSTAWGFGSLASNYFATAWGGASTQATGSYSTAWGSYTLASSYYATAWGSGTTASGSHSTAFGVYTIAPSAYETALGSYGTSYTPASVTGWDASDRLFSIGNGVGTGTRSDAFSIQKNGNATLAGTLSTSSDRSLKTNINQLDNSLDNILQLNGYTYNWKAAENRDTKLQIGVIAQEVETLYPELIRKDGNGKLTVIYAGLIPVLIEATKEQQATIDQQATEITAIKKENEILKTRLDNIEKLLSQLTEK